MNGSPLFRRLFLAPPAFRAPLLPYIRQPIYTIRSQRYATTQTVAERSFWLSLIPKPLRRSPGASLKKKIISKEWNPATFFINIFLLIGSMSIQMIALRNESEASTRRADAKIGVLKEIIEKIQNGEEVDVERLLGTGDEESEKEWEEVLQEIEREDQAWTERKKPRHGRNLQKPSPPSSKAPEAEAAPGKVKSAVRPQFY